MLIRTVSESFVPDTDDASLIYRLLSHRRLVFEMIQLVGHVAITVRDLQETIEFYTKLGFQLTSRNETPTQTVVFLVAGKARLEVFAPKKTKSPIELGPEDLGIKHIAFEVDDIQKSYEEAKAKGVVFTETRMRTDGSVGTVFFKDPSGIILQFIQRASG
jgi:glyoxylase I family protein